MATSNFIEINGKTYDAQTGKLLKAAAKSAQNIKQSVTTHAKSTKAATGRFIDSIQPSGGSAYQPLNKPLKVKSKVSTKPKVVEVPKTGPAKTTRKHATAPHLKHKIQHTATFYRKGLKAPDLKVKEAKIPGRLHKVDKNERLERALKVGKSDKVSRFNAAVHKPQLKKAVHQPEPVKTNVKVSKPANVAAPQIKAQPKAVIKPASAAPKSKASVAKPERRYKKHVSKVGFGIAVLTVLVLGAYLAYLNIPTVSLKVASSQANFSATLPGYRPTDFGYNGPITYANGAVTIKYHNNKDQRHFTVSEQTTNWDSEALKESLSKDIDPTVVPVQDSGLTIYFSEGKASWVNAGKLYTVDTNGSQLDISDITKIATSM